MFAFRCSAWFACSALSAILRRAGLVNTDGHGVRVRHGVGVPSEQLHETLRKKLAEAGMTCHVRIASNCEPGTRWPLGWAGEAG